MIHLATIHFERDEWIDLQLDYLDRNSSEPIETWASVDGIDERRLADFAHAWNLGVEPLPEEKLDRLGEEICAEAADDDIVVFTHGDTLPLPGWTERLRALLADSPLVAVRRDENFGEPVAHPCFAATTVKFWREFGSSWAEGPSWTEPDGRSATDVGATLWRDLSERGVDWTPLLRSNAIDLHPLWFAIYGELVYHHGAGFRNPMSRADGHTSRSWPMPLRRVHWAWRSRRNQLLARRVLRSLQRDGDVIAHLRTGR